MKAAVGLCVFLLAITDRGEAARLSDAGRSATVDKVVKMLQGMLKQSQDDWKSEKEAYSKFKCYCDDNADEKGKSVQDASTSISLLSSKIDEIRGANGALSIQTAQLKADLADNEKSRVDAEGLREKEKTSFQEEVKDLTTAIEQLDGAIKMLADVGADQTLAQSSDHEKFMAKYKEKSLVSLRTSLKLALTAASSFLDPGRKAKVLAFLQAPFTGTYTAQSGQIIGILKDMKETFESNLQTARATEKKREGSARKVHEQQGI